MLFLVTARQLTLSVKENKDAEKGRGGLLTAWLLLLGAPFEPSPLSLKLTGFLLLTKALSMCGCREDAPGRQRSAVGDHKEHAGLHQGLRE